MYSITNRAFILMQLTKGHTITVVIKEIAFGGNAVGMPIDEALKGFITFVSGAVLPDEVAEVKLTKIKKNYLEAELVRIITTDKDRNIPRCKHFGICGGCSLQHVPYTKQLEIKDTFVQDALIKFGGFSKEYIAHIKKPIIACDSPWYYRNKSEYTFESGKAGFHARGNFRTVFDLEECFLQSEIAVAILQCIKDWARVKNISTYDWSTRQGIIKNLVIREGKNTGEILVNLITTQDNFIYEKDFIELIRSNFPQVTSLYRSSVIVRRGFKTVNNEYLLWGKETLTEKLSVGNNSLHFEILPQAFFQPNTLQAEKLYRVTINYAQPTNTDHVLDLFCGTGSIGMFCALSGSRVTGIDLSESAIMNAQKNAEKNNIKNITFYPGDTGKELKKLQEIAQTATILITDPPRAGIEPKTLEKIIGLTIPRWVYVSCNPTTLARDLKIICNAPLINGKKYRLASLSPVDMFPQTFHIETVVLLEQYNP